MVNVVNEETVGKLTTYGQLQILYSSIRIFLLKVCKHLNQSIIYICLTSLTRAKCGTRSTLCWKVGNISGSTELFVL